MKKISDLFPARSTGHNTLHKNRVKEDLTWFSLKQILLTEGKVNEDFLLLLSNLSLEEIIALKLEISFQPVDRRRTTVGYIPIWKSMPYISRDAILKWAVSVTNYSGGGKGGKKFMTAYKLLAIGKADLLLNLTMYGIDRYIEYFHQKHYVDKLNENQKNLFYSFKKNKDIIRDLPKKDE